MPIYTKKGDKGMTKTFYGEMNKSDDLAEALGSVDELNSWMGMVRTSLSSPPPKLGGGRKRGGINLDPEFKRIQNNLMIIGSQLAGVKKQDIRFTNYEIRRLENLIDKLTAEMLDLSNFIYPVGYLQVARAVCRRCEREMIRYFESTPLLFPPNLGGNQRGGLVIKYLNRLSDALFVMARWVNFGMGVKEEIWNR